MCASALAGTVLEGEEAQTKSSEFCEEEGESEV